MEYGAYRRGENKALESTADQIKEHKHHRKVPQCLKRVFEEEKRIVEMKAQISSEIGVAAPMITGTGTYRPYLTARAKLPKLEKSSGTHIDWFWFWNQFEAEINKSSAPQITKFSYLKELFKPSV